MSELFINLNHQRRKIKEDYFKPSSLAKSSSPKLSEPSIPTTADQTVDKEGSVSGSSTETDTDTEDEEDEDLEDETIDLDNEDEDEDSDTSSSDEEETELTKQLSIFDEHRDYRYLDKNSDALQYDFGRCSQTNDVTKKYTVYMCGYQVNEHGLFPFLQYFMILINDAFTFPAFQFRCYANLSAKSSEDYTPEHVYFQNECIKEMSTIVNIHHHHHHRHHYGIHAISNMYRGFTLAKDKEDTIYAFFNLDTFMLHPSLPDSPKQLWATIDEIVHIKQAVGFNIDSSVVLLFTRLPELCRIYDKYDHVIETPSVMYLCEQDGSSYKNLFKPKEDETMSIGEPSFTLVNDRVDHPMFGNFYIFSIFHFPTSQSLFLIRRFVGFLVKPLYIVKSLTSLLDYTKPVVTASGEPMTLGKIIPAIVDYVTQKTAPSSSSEEKELEERPSEEKPSEEKPSEEKPSEEKPSEEKPSEEKQTKQETSEEETSEEKSLEEKELEEKPSEEKPSEETEPPITETKQQVEVQKQDEDIDAKEIIQKELDDMPNLDNTCTYFHEIINGENVPFWMIKSSLHFTEL